MQKEQLLIQNFNTTKGDILDIPLTYQCFGLPLHTAPIVFVLHALTGNSNVAGEDGWWKDIVAEGKPLDTSHFTIICFNIPGNGYDNFFFSNDNKITTRDIARLFILGLQQLHVDNIDIMIGGSVGGAIGWTMLSEHPKLVKTFIPIATHYETSDWLYAQCQIQEFLLEDQENGLEKARYHAMLCYRTPNSINHRFQNFRLDNNVRKSTDWLNYHGKALSKRFQYDAYKMVNHLLLTIENNKEDLENIEAEIHLIGIDSDLFFTPDDMKDTLNLNFKNKTKQYHEIVSEHGHDAFLMEYKQLENILINILR